MKILVFNTQSYEPPLFTRYHSNHTFVFYNAPLSISTVHEANGYDGICCFVTDCLDEPVIASLALQGVKLIALRSAGFDHIDLVAAKKANITVVRVPDYAPESIAEFAVTLILALNRQIITAYEHGQQHNFSLDGLMGFNLYQKTIGIIGTGHIGTAFAKIMHGFGCKLLAVDPTPNQACLQLKVHYVDLPTLLATSDIISLHCPLTSETKHLLNQHTFSYFKKGAMLINTGRGALCDTTALINALSEGTVGYAGLDVYEFEKGLFFKDHHHTPIDDPLFLKLQAFPTVLITPHQAFFTKEALSQIISTTINNISAYEEGKPINQVI